MIWKVRFAPQDTLVPQDNFVLNINHWCKAYFALWPWITYIFMHHMSKLARVNASAWYERLVIYYWLCLNAVNWTECNPCLLLLCHNMQLGSSLIIAWAWKCNKTIRFSLILKICKSMLSYYRQDTAMSRAVIKVLLRQRWIENI